MVSLGLRTVHSQNSAPFAPVPPLMLACAQRAVHGQCFLHSTNTPALRLVCARYAQHPALCYGTTCLF